jgi:type II secretory pathway pseudopilin PulG
MKINVRTNEGFTLVELLASVIVLVAIGSVIAGIISSSLRGANKTNTIENIRQNGNYALAQISKDIEYALPFDGKKTGLIRKNSEDEDVYDTSCILALSPTPIPVTQYSAIAVESPIKITGVVGSPRKIIRYDCNGSVFAANYIPLIDTTETTSISLKNCSIACTQYKATDVPIIKISFSIEPKNLSILSENNAQSSITFETSVVLRNYER